MGWHTAGVGAGSALGGADPHGVRFYPVERVEP